MILNVQQIHNLKENEGYIETVDNNSLLFARLKLRTGPEACGVVDAFKVEMGMKICPNPWNCSIVR